MGDPTGRPRFGANWVPSAGWFHGWLDLRPDDVRRDFEDLAGLGLDHVRIFPVWPWIQPNRGLVRASALDDVARVLDLAAELGLDVAVDLVQGHLSSFDFLPSWVLTWHRRSVFTDADVVDGISRYVQAVVGAVADRPNLLAVTTGNEVNNLWPGNDTDPVASTAWARTVVATARAAAPHVPVVHSLYDDVFYDPAHPFHPHDVTEVGDLSSVHSWVFNGVARVDPPAAPDRPLGRATLSHAAYLVELAAATATDPQRPVWLQEVGAPAPEVGPTHVEGFVRETLAAAFASPRLWGVTWWCSHDLHRSLVDLPEREYDLGLFTTDHEPKPVARAYAAAIREWAPAASSRPALVCDVDLLEAPDRRAEVAPGRAFHRAWMEASAGGPLAILPASRAADSAALATRGIGELRSLPSQ